MPTFVLLKQFNFLKEFIVLLVYELLTPNRVEYKENILKKKSC